MINIMKLSNRETDDNIGRYIVECPTLVEESEFYKVMFKLDCEFTEEEEEDSNNE